MGIPIEKTLVEKELAREEMYNELVRIVENWIYKQCERNRFNNRQVPHILLRYIFNKKATLPNEKSDPVFITGASQLAREQLSRDFDGLRIKNSERLADLIDTELAKANREMRFKTIENDVAVCFSADNEDELLYGTRSQKDFAGLARRYGAQHYNAAFAIGLRYSYLRLLGHGLARAYRDDTKRMPNDPSACEGFASAFNHYFDRYHSAFPDLERYFGSRGCFFKIEWEKEPANMTYYLCPPFDEALMQLCVNHVFLALRSGSVLQPKFVFSIPGTWKNFSALESLKACAWVEDIKDYAKGELRFIDYMASSETDRIIYPTDICVITLSLKKTKDIDKSLSGETFGYQRSDSQTGATKVISPKKRAIASEVESDENTDDDLPFKKTKYGSGT